MVSAPALKVSLDRKRYATGDTVVAHVNLAEGRRARGARVELRYRNSWWMDQGVDTLSKSRTSDDIEVARVPLAEAIAGSLEAGERTARLTIPGDAPPSGPDIHWRVRAVIDLPLRPDLRAERTLTVRSRAAQYEVLADAADRPDPQLELDVARIAKVGETLSGRLTLSARSDIEASEVRVDLTYADSLAPQGTRVARVLLAGHERFTVGETRSFRFTLALPAGGPPTTYAAKTTSRWHLTGTVARALAPDLSTRRELFVHNGPSIPEG